MNYLATVWGTVNSPPGVTQWGRSVVGGTSGLQRFLSAGIKTLIVIAGVYALLNLILAGYDYMSAGANPDKIAKAWSKIWQTMIGLVIAAGSIVIASILGQIIFGNPNALLQLTIYTP
jgi:hypothetical protein